MDPAQRTRAIEELALACAGAAKAISELRERLIRDGEDPATHALMRQLSQEITEHQTRMRALLAADEGDCSPDDDAGSVSTR